jgi:hypothetical protein
MTTTDKFSVAVTLDKAAYNAGDTITATLSGNDVQTTTVATPQGPFTGQVVANDGATLQVTIAAFTVNSTVAAPQSVKFDTTAPIADPSGRKWTFGPDGLTATATA